jgi:hypothetical protein
MSITDYRDLIRELKKLDFIKAMRKNIRNDAKPLMKEIQNKIPTSAPLGNMSPQVNKIGRLAWSRGIPAKKVTFAAAAPGYKKKTTALIKLVVPSAMTVVTDMAGKSGKYVNSRPLIKGFGSSAMMVERGKYKGQMGYRYTYRDGRISGRIHRTNNQGRRMIENLSARSGSASRYVWRGGAAGLEQTRTKLRMTLNSYVNIVNKNLRS